VDSNQDKGRTRILDIARLESEVSQLGWLIPMGFTQVTSTNDVVIENFSKVRAGSGLLVVADEQTVGRGRLDRKWSTPAGSGIAMSLGLSTSDFSTEISTVPLIVGLATRRALIKFQVPAELKWPNDIVISDSGTKKLGGILIQLVQDKLVIGIGLNVDLGIAELPVPQATSLLIQGFEIDRIELIVAILIELKLLIEDGSKWQQEYANACSTIGKEIKVTNFDGSQISGVAIGIDPTGALEIKNLENLYQITVGDIEYLEVSQD
jgi:BirA family biotin operon repressor/biotin-[acetyl-CoA-carboxylase] ligase